MGLSNYQLVLLDNLIYLEEVVRIKEGATIEKIVNNLLYKDGDKSNGIGSGTIEQDWRNPYKPEAENCMTSKEEWIAVLKAIAADPVLCSLTVHKVEDHKSGELDGFRAMALTGDAVDENIIIFQGTTAAEEWMDDAVGGYSIQTPGQKCALDFVNGLDIVNNKAFVVSGHSKGGNMAQYVALFASDPVIDKCLSFDGQGFSRELCETEAYQTALAKKGQNLYLIASSGDFVNVLFNSPVPDDHKMYIKANNGISQFADYHKPGTILALQDDGSGYPIAVGFNTVTTIDGTSIFLQDFIAFILEKETNVQNKKIVFDGLMGILAAEAETDDDIKLGVSKEMVLALVAMPVLAGYSGILAPYGMDSANIPVMGFDSYMQILEEIAAETYKGVVFKAVKEGALTLMLGYLAQYIMASSNNLYATVEVVKNVIDNKGLDGWGEIGKQVLNLFWPVGMNLFDTTDGGSYEKYIQNKYDSFAVNSVLGEGSKGVVYRKSYEDGGMLYIGSGENEAGITGTANNDILFGGNGADTIYGGAGNDSLWGGRGDDLLNGGTGSDRYIFGLYDGWDTITNQRDGNLEDFIVFTKEVKPSDLSFAKMGMNLIIKVGDLSRVTVEKFFERDGKGKFIHAIDGILFNSNDPSIDFQTICRRAGVEYTNDELTEGIGGDLTEEEKKLLEEEDEKLRQWYERYYKKRGDADGQEIPDIGGTEEGVSGNVPGGEDGNGTEGGTGSDTGGGTGGGASASGNAGNSSGVASEEIFGSDPGDYDDSMHTTYCDPIVIDLNGDGMFTTAVADGVYFDLNKDGFAEKTAWVSPGDGLLVRDVNGNGRIDDGGELFGDQTVLSNGTVAESGFQALSDLDDNRDGVLDAQDKAYGELKVWVDANHNGISEAEELHSLEDFGITAVDLEKNRINRLDRNGNLIKAESNIYGQDADYTIGEYGFVADYWDTEYRGEDVDTSGISGVLPEIKGSGTLQDLSKAMAGNDKLKSAVLQYIGTKNYEIRKSMLSGILFMWAGVEETEPDSRGMSIDARQLGVLEKVYGKPFVGVTGANPNRVAADVLKRLYAAFEQEAEWCLLSQSVYRAALDKIRVYHNAQTEGNYSDFVPVFQTLAQEASLQDIPAFAEHILKYTVLGEMFDKTYIYEQVRSEDENLAEYIRVDHVRSRAVKGHITGGSGNDLYIFPTGSRQLVIEEKGGTDWIQFGEGIRAEDIRVSRDYYSLYLTNQESGDRVQIYKFFEHLNYGIERVEFADGTVWTREELLDKARYYYGTEGRDEIGAYDPNPRSGIGYAESYLYGGGEYDRLRGADGNDKLYGEGGNDTLEGGKGDDLLAGGTGNDLLKGGEGDDVYLFSLGDGQDTIEESDGKGRIVFGEGICAEDIRISRDYYSLYLTNQESGDRVQIYKFFEHLNYGIERVEFADGTVWTTEELLDKARYYYGTEGRDEIGAYDPNPRSGIGYAESYLYGGGGNDTLRGRSGNDELYGEGGNDTLDGGEGNDLLAGGTGNDTLKGGVGDDTYLFSLGDGQDTIIESGGNDRIIFGEGIHGRDLMFERWRDDLRISVLGGDDRITISNYYQKEDNQVESFKTSDGSVLDYTKLNVMIQAMASFEETTGMMWEDAIEQNNKEADDLVNQWWTKEVI